MRSSEQVLTQCILTDDAQILPGQDDLPASVVDHGRMGLALIVLVLGLGFVLVSAVRRRRASPRGQRSTLPKDNEGWAATGPPTDLGRRDTIGTPSWPPQEPAAEARSTSPVEGPSSEARTARTTPVPRAGMSPPAADGWAVETHGLTKRFGDNVAVNGVELLVPRGSAFGYLGPNGAGKTTLIRVLLGLTHADAGTMSLLGHSVPRHRDEALARVGAIVDEPRFHAHLTGRQNLQVLAAAREPAASRRIAASLERVGILHRADDKVSTYSMGMRQRLGVAACLIGNPDLLILDEPMNGLDPAGMQDMRQMIGSLVAEGRTVVLSSHLLDEVERTCDAVAIVDRGSVVRQGPIAELLAGSSVTLQVGCSDPVRASALISATNIGAADEAAVTADPTGLTVILAAGTGHDAIAEINRVLVEGGISVYRLQVVQASLESWFLQVTTRLGEPQ
jgi:ABC-2 type transport system ATP-binding protein